MRLRYLCSLIVTILLAFSAGSAHAQSSNIYFAGYFGLSTFSDRDFSESTTPASGSVETDDALNFGAALGFRLSPQFRIEAEAGYVSSDLESIKVAGREFRLGGDSKTYSLMLNGYYDIETGWPITPFLGAGIGFGYHEGDINDVAGITVDASGDDWTLLYNVGGGLKYRVSDSLAFTSAYRYVGSSDVSWDQTEIDYSAHEFRIGLEYDLPFE